MFQVFFSFLSLSPIFSLLFGRPGENQQGAAVGEGSTLLLPWGRVAPWLLLCVLAAARSCGGGGAAGALLRYVAAAGGRKVPKLEFWG